MGAFSSKSNCAFVYLEKPSYAPGELVSGLALVNVTTMVETKAVVLKVEGYEKVSWTEIEKKTITKTEDGETKTETTTETHHRSAEKEFWKVKQPLYTAPQWLMPGQYQFPFRFMLPHNLPGSMVIKDAHSHQHGLEMQNVKAAIKYKIKVECSVQGILKPNIKGKSYITVFQMPTKPPTELRAEHFQEVKTCCCIGQGNAHMIARIEKDWYMAGETANVILEVDNQSDKDFNAINAKLVRKVHLKADGGHYQDEDDMAKNSYPGVGNHTSAMGPNARVLSVALPPNLVSSTNGHLIDVEYKIMLECKAGAMTSNVKLKVPIQVFAPMPGGGYVPNAAPPEWWRPTVVAEPVQLQLPSAPPMPPSMQAMLEPAFAPPQPTYAAQ